MACTKALSLFSCTEPPFPGLTNSRKTPITLGGGGGSCATATPRPTSRRCDASSSPVIFLVFFIPVLFIFIDADLPGREIDLDQIFWKGLAPSNEKRLTRGGRRLFRRRP